MIRWIVVVLVALAVIVLVSPGIVGRLAERRVAESLAFAASDSDAVVVTAGSFERGWFTSQGRHRLELRQGVLRALLGVDDHVPSLIIETRLDHGLVPVTSLARESGSLKPGLASAVSTMKLDRGGGEMVDVPGKIYSAVGIDDSRANAVIRFDLSRVPMAGLGAVDLSMDAKISGLDAQSINAIATYFRDARAGPEQQNVLSGSYPFIAADVQTLLNSGLEIRFDRIALALPDSPLTAALRFTLPPSARTAEFSWPSLLLALDASADLRLPVELYEIAASRNPDAASLVAMGVLKKDGDYYQMQARFAMGLLTINGAPLPVPLP